MIIIILTRIILYLFEKHAAKPPIDAFAYCVKLSKIKNVVLLLKKRIILQIQVTTRSTKIFTTGGSKVNSVTAKANFHNGTSGQKMIVEDALEPITITLTRNQDNKLENETELTSLYNKTFPWGTKMALHAAGTEFVILISVLNFVEIIN